MLLVIAAMEEEIREAHPGENLIFPPSYPRSCLIGRVEVSFRFLFIYVYNL